MAGVLFNRGFKTGTDDTNTQNTVVQTVSVVLPGGDTLHGIAVSNTSTVQDAVEEAFKKKDMPLELLKENFWVGTPDHVVNKQDPKCSYKYRKSLPIVSPAGIIRTITIDDQNLLGNTSATPSCVTEIENTFNTNILCNQDGLPNTSLDSSMSSNLQTETQTQKASLTPSKSLTLLQQESLSKVPCTPQLTQTGQARKCLSLTQNAPNA